MKCFVFIALAIVMIAGVFLVGIWVGFNRTFPYNELRSFRDKVVKFESNIVSQETIGVVIFGDSLSARGDWRVIQKSDDFELLILAKGGLKASKFPYNSSEYGGDIHVYWLGTNDLLGDLDYVNAYASILALADRSHRNGKKIVIQGLPIPLEQSKFLRSIFKNYNRALRELCNEKSWTFIDTEKLLNNHYNDRADSSRDGIHLNLEASKLIAVELIKVCNSLI